MSNHPHHPNNNLSLIFPSITDTKWSWYDTPEEVLNGLELFLKAQYKIVTSFTEQMRETYENQQRDAFHRAIYAIKTIKPGANIEAAERVIKAKIDRFDMGWQMYTSNKNPCLSHQSNLIIPETQQNIMIPINSPHNLPPHPINNNHIHSARNPNNYPEQQQNSYQQQQNSHPQQPNSYSLVAPYPFDSCQNSYQQHQNHHHHNPPSYSPLQNDSNHIHEATNSHTVNPSITIKKEPNSENINNVNLNQRKSKSKNVKKSKPKKRSKRRNIEHSQFEEEEEEDEEAEEQGEESSDDDNNGDNKEYEDSVPSTPDSKDADYHPPSNYNHNYNNGNHVEYDEDGNDSDCMLLINFVPKKNSNKNKPKKSGKKRPLNKINENNNLNQSQQPVLLYFGYFHFYFLYL